MHDKVLTTSNNKNNFTKHQQKDWDIPQQLFCFISLTRSLILYFSTLSLCCKTPRRSHVIWLLHFVTLTKKFLLSNHVLFKIMHWNTSNTAITMQCKWLLFWYLDISLEMLTKWASAPVRKTSLAANNFALE